MALPRHLWLHLPLCLPVCPPGPPWELTQSRRISRRHRNEDAPWSGIVNSSSSHSVGCNLFLLCNFTLVRNFRWWRKNGERRFLLSSWVILPMRIWFMWFRRGYNWFCIVQLILRAEWFFFRRVFSNGDPRCVSCVRWGVREHRHLYNGMTAL